MTRKNPWHAEQWLKDELKRIQSTAMNDGGTKRLAQIRDSYGGYALRGSVVEFNDNIIIYSANPIYREKTVISSKLKKLK